MALVAAKDSLSSELVSYNLWEVWVFPVLQCTVILADGCRPPWERRGGRFSVPLWSHSQAFTQRDAACTPIKSLRTGTSLVVQWLRLCASNAGAWVRSLVGELRSCKMQSRKKKKKNLKRASGSKTWLSLGLDHRL